jgi:DNA polymerase-3 subunit delta
MATKKQDRHESAELDALKDAIAKGVPERLYIFYGEERYLLENYLDKLRKLLTAGGFSDFNHRHFDGQGLSVEELAEACDTLPAFAERSLIEVHDFDIFKAGDEVRQKLAALFSDLPDYVCLVFVYDTVEWNPDNRLAFTKELKKTAKLVEFPVQEQSRLVKWIRSHFAENGKTIDTATCEYLAFVTGGLMTSLNTEIDKISSFAAEDVITRAHIDDIVTPVLDAVAYRLTDHIAAGNFDAAAAVLFDLLCMREPPHKLIYSVTLKLHQLLTARLLYENMLGEKELMKMCDIKFEFQARNLLSSARRTTAAECRRAVLLSADTAYRMNSGGDLESSLTELLIDLAENRRSARV